MILKYNMIIHRPLFLYECGRVRSDIGLHFVLIVIMLFIASGVVGEEYTYRIDRKFEKIEISGGVSVYEIIADASDLRPVIGPFSINVSDSESGAREYEKMTWGYESSSAAWDPIQQSFSDQGYKIWHEDIFDDPGWIKGSRSVGGVHGAYLWMLQNELTFKTSDSHVYSIGDQSYPIGQVLVGTLGDYSAGEWYTEIWPKIGDGTFSPAPNLETLEVDLSETVVYNHNLNAYYLIIKVDLDVDTDRDGSVEDEEDENGEDNFTKDRGAVVVVNGDRDNGGSSADNLNTVVDANNDVDDLSRIVIRRTGFTSLPSGMRAILRITNEQSEMIRIFSRPLANEAEILGPSSGIVNGVYKEHVLDSSWITGSASTWTLGAEALRFPYEYYYNENNQFRRAPEDGKVRVWLIFQVDQGSGSWSEIGNDEIVLQIAPPVLSWNGQSVEKIYATEVILGDDLDDQIRSETAVPVEGVLITSGAPLPQDYFVQDYFEVFNSGREASHKIPVYADLEHDNAINNGFNPGVYENDASYGFMSLPNLGNGGDLEVTPPLTDHPLGRAVLGSECFPLTKLFLEKQKVQVPVIGIDTTWLVVGHVDEFFSFVPKGLDWSLLVASPREAVNMLHALESTGSGNVSMRCGFKDVGDGHFSVEDILVKNRNGYPEKTTVTVPVTVSDTVFTLTSAKFQNGDYLRIGNEYVKITGGGGTTSISVNRAQLGSTPSVYGSGSLLYCLSDLVRENLDTFTFNTVVKDGPQRMIDNEINSVLLPALGGSADIRELPVLFYRRDDKWSAYTPNFVNCLVADGKAFMPESDGPESSGINWFHQRVEQKMSGTVAPVFINAWTLHMCEGEVHCGSNARRSPIAGTDWWVAWPE